MRWRWLLALATGALSGFSALVYQVVWQRMVAWDFGGDTVSTAVVSGTFLLGLGLGAWIGSRVVAGRRAYGLLEILIGVIGASSHLVIVPLAGVLARIGAASPDQAEGLRFGVVLGAVLLLLPPATLIGGTLPLMLGTFAESLGATARTVGILCAANTLGAWAGVVVAPLLLLGSFSLPTTLAAAAALNVAVGTAILVFGPEPTPRPAVAPPRAVATSSTIVSIALLSGFLATSFQASLYRAFRVMNPSSAYNFPFVLAAFLLALALGGWLLSRRVEDRPRALARRAGLLLAGAALAVPASIWAAAAMRARGFDVSFLPIVDGHGWANLPAVLAHAALLVMPAPFLTGAILPLLLRLAGRRPGSLARGAGWAAPANAFGCFAGLLFGDFVGIPLLGTQGYLLAVSMASGAAGLYVAALADRRSATPGRLTLAAAAGVAGVVLGSSVPDEAWRIHVIGPADLPGQVREGSTGVAEIRWRNKQGEVRVNGQFMSAIPRHPRHVKQEVFLLAQARRQRVLMLGLGGGGILRSLVDDPGVRKVEVVEWSSELVALLAKDPAAVVLRRVLASPKVVLHEGDARVVLDLLPARAFDLVFDNLAFPAWAGATSLNSPTYFARVERVLRPRGVFVKGANYYPGDDRAAVLSGLVETFAHVAEHASGEVVVSTDGPPPRYSPARVLAVIEPRWAFWSDSPLDRAEALRWFVSGFEPIDEESLRGARPLRDDFLGREYYWRPWETEEAPPPAPPTTGGPP